MDRFTYERLRVKRPELSLPLWHTLRRTDRHRARLMTSDQIIARRVAKLLVREPGTVDAIQPRQKKRRRHATASYTDGKWRVFE